MSAAEFTIVAAPPPDTGRGRHGKVKSEIRLKIEALQPGQCLLWRPTGAVPSGQPHSAMHFAGKELGRAFTARKVDGGYDIYRTA